MEAGAEDLQPHSPSIQQPTDQPPTQPTSGEERGSEVEETLSPDKDHTVSSPLRQSQAQTPGRDLGSLSGCWEERWKQGHLFFVSCLGFKSGSVIRAITQPCGPFDHSSNEPPPQPVAPVHTGRGPLASGDAIALKCELGGSHPRALSAGASPDECSVSLEKEREKVLAEGHSSESEKTRDASPRRSPERHPGGGKRPRSRSPGDQPPPLRKHLVTSLRTMSEAICQNMLQVYHQQGHSPPTREQLAQLRGPLFAAVHTFYAMANQAAYVFPADSWLVPTPLPEPQGPAKDGGEAQGCKDSPSRPQTACQ
uniref:Uncharacterized protein n=1 Tax=Sus scrofa TaxID=9823 RepID=A0A5G2R0U8_PIG